MCSKTDHNLLSPLLSQYDTQGTLICESLEQTFSTLWWESSFLFSKHVIKEKIKLLLCHLSHFFFLKDWESWEVRIVLLRSATGCPQGAQNKYSKFILWKTIFKWLYITTNKDSFQGILLICIDSETKPTEFKAVWNLFWIEHRALSQSSLHTPLDYGGCHLHSSLPLRFLFYGSFRNCVRDSISAFYKIMVESSLQLNSISLYLTCLPMKIPWHREIYSDTSQQPQSIFII